MKIHNRVLVPLVLLFLCSCGQRAKDGATTTDALGRSVTLPDTILTISSLAPSITETIYAAGSADKLISGTTADNFPSEIENIEKIGSFPLDIERLVALDPDIVFASDQVNRVDEADRLVELGIPVFFLASSSFDDILESIRTVATITSTPQGLEQADILLGAVRMIRSQVVLAGPSGRSVLVLVDYKELYSFGKGSYIHELIEFAGGNSITSHLDVRNPVLSEEFVLAEDPEIIIGSFGSDFSVEDLLEVRPSWAGLSAVRNERVYSINSDILLRPGPRVVDALAIITNWVTPEAFQSSN